MESHEADARRQDQTDRGARFAALASLIVVAVVVAVIVLGTTGGSSSHAPKPKATHSAASASARSGPAATSAVPILAYHIINQAPAQTSLSASLYVPADQFSAQMQALKAAGWHAVTLDQVQAYWTRGASLGSGKPIVITFDDGYASQYTGALPVLKQLGWVGVENLRVNGLSPSDGGLADSQVRGLIAAGWELDTDGMSQPDLTSLTPDQLPSEVTSARQTLRARYSVPVNWFCYPSGRYNPSVTAAVQAAGFIGATTTVSGWASPKADRFLFPRLNVTAGTTPSQLLSQIASAEQNTSAPATSTGT